MIWGMHAGGWMSGLYGKAADPQMALLELLAEFGLKSTGWGAKELATAEPARREALAAAARKNGIHINLGLGGDFLTTSDAQARELSDQAIAQLQLLQPVFKPLVCITGINRDYHHYSRDIPVAQQIRILSQRMAPLAAACAEAGAPLCIHTVTHFAADYAELCRKTPGLALCFDTANCFLIGEVPLDAAKIMAPHVRSSHFKDHYAYPEFKPLGLRVRGATPGEGDVQLTAIYDILKSSAPSPATLSMELEIDPVRDAEEKDLDKRAVLTASMAYVKSLEAR